MTLTVTQPDATRPPLQLVTGGLPVVSSALEGAVTGIIQRSPDNIRWTTVRGAIDMEIDGSGDVADVDDYEFRPGVLNRYRGGTMQEVVDTFTRTESGVWGDADTGQEWGSTIDNGLALPGTSGSYASTPDTAVLDITGDIDLRADVTMVDWTPAAGNATLLGKWTASANQISYILQIVQTTGFPRIAWSTDGTAGTVDALTADALPPVDDGGRLAIRVTFDVNNGAGGKTATFYTAPTLAGPWTQLGTPQTVAGTTSIFSGSADLLVGALNAGTANLWMGTVHAAEVRNGIAGTVVADPDFEAEAVGTTSFADDAGRTWTVQGTAAIAPAGNALDVAGGAGTITSPAESFFNATLTTPDDIGDMRMTYAFTTSANGVTGESIYPTGYFRLVDGDNHYAAALELSTTGVVRMHFIKRVDGITQTTIVALPFTYTSSATVIRVEVWAVGPRVRIRAWVPATDPAPDWQIDETVEAAYRLFSGKVGLQVYRPGTNTNVGLVTSFSDFVVDTGSPTFLAALADDITPTLDGFWLTSTMRSFLNCAPMVIAFEDPGREGRGGAQYVAGRTLPVAQAELMGSREWNLTLRVPTLVAARNLEYVIASGDVFYLLAPTNCPIPSGYYRVGTMASRRVIPRGVARLFTLPLFECAAPGPDVATAQSTWDTVIALYGTWEDVVLAVPTWEDLLELIGDPSEVIVE